MPPKRLRPLAPSDGRPSKRARGSLDTSCIDKPYSCDQCDLSYENSPSLGRHKREKHGTPTRFGCMHCGSEFLRPEGVKNHIDKSRCSSLRGDLTRRQHLTFMQTGGWDPASYMGGSFASRASYTSLLKSGMASWTSPACQYPDFAPASPQNDIPLADVYSILDPNLPTTVSYDGLASIDSTASSMSATFKTIRPVTTRSSLGRAIEHLEQAELHLSALGTSGDIALKRFLMDTRLQSHPGPDLASYYERLKLENKNKTDRLLREQRERRKRDKSRCTRPRPPSRSPLPPAFELPPPQDLEYLLLLQRRARRRLCVMEAFHLTHRKLTAHALVHMDSEPTECGSGRIVRHTTNVKQAWTDAVTTVHRLLSGNLPRELHSVLGVAQLASAIRSAMDDIDSSIVSEDKFLSDLCRWRQLLPPESYAAFDCYADLLWDNRPPSGPASDVSQDTETLLYFQDLLAEMLSHIESTPPKEVELDSALPPLDVVSHSQDFPTHSVVSSIPVPNEVSPAIMNNLVIPNEDDFKPSILADLTLYATGAIFALIIAYILLYTGHFTVQVLCLCFITTETPSHDHRDRLRWLQHASLLANCRLLEFLIQQLGMDRILVAETPTHQLPPPTMLGGLGWQQLIAQCFEAAAEVNFAMPDV